MCSQTHSVLKAKIIHVKYLSGRSDVCGRQNSVIPAVIPKVQSAIASHRKTPRAERRSIMEHAAMNDAVLLDVCPQHAETFR